MSNANTNAIQNKLNCTLCLPLKLTILASVCCVSMKHKTAATGERRNTRHSRYKATEICCISNEREAQIGLYRFIYGFKWARIGSNGFELVQLGLDGFNWFKKSPDDLMYEFI